MRTILLHVFVLTVFVFANRMAKDACEHLGFLGNVEMNGCNASDIEEDMPQMKPFKTAEAESPILRDLSAEPNNEISDTRSGHLPRWALFSIFSPPPNIG